MARMLTTEMFQGTSLSSLGAHPCQPGQNFDPEANPERRRFADAGKPVVRW
jgi:hypothetical protein